VDVGSGFLFGYLVLKGWVSVVLSVLVVVLVFFWVRVYEDVGVLGGIYLLVSSLV